MPKAYSVAFYDHEGFKKVFDENKLFINKKAAEEFHKSHVITTDSPEEIEISEFNYEKLLTKKEMWQSELQS